MTKQRVHVGDELQAWVEALTTLATLQKELVRVSQDMTFTDDWSWMVPFRQLVSGVWDTIAKTPPDNRIEAAKTLQEQARAAIDVVQEYAVHNAFAKLEAKENSYRERFGPIPPITERR